MSESEDRPEGDEAASSEPSAPDAAATTDPPKPDVPEAAVVPASRRRLRLAILGGVAAIGVVALIVVARSRGGGSTTEALIGTGDGGAAIQAPKPPQLPGDQARGLRLTGFVVDGTNTPVVGAEVSAELEKGMPDRALAGSGSGSAAGSGSGSAAPVITAPPTGSDGRFVLDTQVAGRYRLRVTGPGLLPAEVRYVPVPSDEARIVVARRVTIEGVVLDGKSLVGNVTVGVRGEAIGGGIEVKTDAKGAFKLADLPEGRYQVYAWKDTLAARAMRVNRLGAGPFAPVELSLEAASIVVGRVVDRVEGSGLRAAIELRPSGDDQAPRYVRTADDGTFRIEGVPNGRWIADAFSPGYISLGGVELDAGKGIPELALERGGVIEGRVIDRAGKPIANATVRALTGSSNAQAQQGQVQQVQEQSAAVDQDRLRRFSGRIAAPAIVVGPSTAADPQLLPRGELGVLVGPIPPIPPAGAQIARPTTVIPDAASGALIAEPAPLVQAESEKRASIWVTGTDGRYRIAGLSRGRHVVLAVAPAFAEGRAKPVAIELRKTIGDVDVTLGSGTMIVGRVTDQHGVKVVGAQVHAAPEVGAPLDAFTDDEGNYKLGPVTGTVVLTANAFGHADIKRTLEIAISVDPTPDERREDLVLVVADAVLAGTLDDTTGAPVPSAHVEVIAGAGAGRSTVVGADGTFAIDMLPAGPLRVRVTHPQYPPVELDAQASKGERVKVRLRIPLGGVVEGVLLDGTSGAPLGGVVINAYGPNGATSDATSETTGRWKLGPLRPGRWKLTIEQSGFLAASRELDVPVARAPGTTSVHDIRFDLAKGALVGGTVRDARGRRVNGAAVTVQAASGEGPTATGTTDPQGEFRIRDAPTGEIAITATSGDARGVTRVTVRPGDEVLGLSVELQ